MSTERCSSLDRDPPPSEQLLGGGSRKRERIGSDPNPLIRKLGTDLLVEILIRLPDPRSACRCKIVCQLWRSVISNASFNRRFLSHREIMTRDDLKSIVLSFLAPFPNGVKDRDALRVLHCDKDLVLCGFEDKARDDGKYSRSYLVCNPFTKQWHRLPLAPRKLVRYLSPVTRLVCEPQTSGNRFRVVCMYQRLPPASIRLDVFCSESGEWIKDALVRDGHMKRGKKNVVSCKGELFWKYKEFPGKKDEFVDVFNPFRLDMPPASIDVSEFVAKPGWSLAVSRDALHVIALENEAPPFHLSVWRLEEDHKSWRKQCEGLVSSTSKCCNYEPEAFDTPFLHPQKPQIVYFLGIRDTNVVLCSDLRKEEIELFAKPEGAEDVLYFLVFRPRVSCWATPIPNFEKLRAMHKSSSDPIPKYREVSGHGVPAKGLLLGCSSSKVRHIRKRKTSKVREVERQHVQLD